MIDFELNLPKAKKKKGFTQKEFENYIAKRPGKESNGAWARFVKNNQEAVRKDKLVAKARAEAKAKKYINNLDDFGIENSQKKHPGYTKKEMNALDWVDYNVALFEQILQHQNRKKINKV